MCTKILFLDIDGVLNFYEATARCGIYIGIEDEKVALLKKIVDATEAKIVLSSTWRLGIDNKGHRLEKHVPYLKKKLGKYGLEIYDKTPVCGKNSNHRGQEINSWLKSHPEIKEWVVLDDEWFIDFNQYDIAPHLVQTYFYGSGLTEDDVEKAIKILNGELNYER